MLKITKSRVSLKITRDEKTIVLKPQASPTLKIGSAWVSSNGDGVTPTLSDVQVLQDVSAGVSTPTYDNVVLDKVLSIAYEDKNGGNGHTKTFNYGVVFGEEVVTSTVDTFSYLAQDWTYTKQINYREVDGSPIWDGTTPTVVKI